MTGTESTVEAQQTTLLQIIAETILDHVTPHRMLLFGSRVRGEGHNYSDFDVALEGVRLSVRTRRRLMETLDQRIGPYSVDLVELDVVDQLFADAVRREGEVIFESST